MSKKNPKLQSIVYRFYWLDKKKKATINPRNNNDKCFRYVVTVALSHEGIVKTSKKYQSLSLLQIILIEGNKFSITFERLEKIGIE